MQICSLYCLTAKIGCTRGKIPYFGLDVTDSNVWPSWFECRLQFEFESGFSLEMRLFTTKPLIGVRTGRDGTVTFARSTIVYSVSVPSHESPSGGHTTLFMMFEMQWIISAHRVSVPARQRWNSHFRKKYVLRLLSWKSFGGHATLFMMFEMQSHVTLRSRANGCFHLQALINPKSAVL